MVRPPRIEFQGAFYHVIVRGNQKQNIFVDDRDRFEYLDRVRHYKEKCGFVLYAYVLMSNHVHLLIETTKAPLSKIMQLITFTYTRYFNRKYGKVGHLFQGRYKSFLCNRDEYLLRLVRYIHLNPVRARIVTEPNEYPWSSHKDYTEKSKGLVDTGEVLQLFSGKKVEAKKLYKEFIYEALGSGRDDSFYKAVGQQILGNDTFIENLAKKIDDERSLVKPSLPALFKAIEEQTGVMHEKIISRSREKDAVLARGLLVSAWRATGHKMIDLQPVLKRELSMLSRLSKLVEGDKEQVIVKRILKTLNSCNQA